MLPALQRIDGCVGLSMLVDRHSCRCIATSSWESKAAMRLAAGPVRVIRDRAVEILRGSAMVEEWEIRVMHRNHPTGNGTQPGAGRRRPVGGQPGDWHDALQVCEFELALARLRVPEMA